MAGMWAYRVRDAIATRDATACGARSGSRSASSTSSSMAHWLPDVAPGSKSDPAFAMWFWTLAAITAAGALAALAESPRAVLGPVDAFPRVVRVRDRPVRRLDGRVKVAGWLFVASAILAYYVAIGDDAAGGRGQGDPPARQAVKRGEHARRRAGQADPARVGRAGRQEGAVSSELVPGKRLPEFPPRRERDRLAPRAARAAAHDRGDARASSRCRSSSGRSRTAAEADGRSRTSSRPATTSGTCRRRSSPSAVAPAGRPRRASTGCALEHARRRRRSSRAAGAVALPRRRWDQHTRSTRTRRHPAPHALGAERREAPPRTSTGSRVLGGSGRSRPLAKLAESTSGRRGLAARPGASASPTPASISFCGGLSRGASSRTVPVSSGTGSGSRGRPAARRSRAGHAAASRRGAGASSSPTSSSRSKRPRRQSAQVAPRPAGAARSRSSSARVAGSAMPSSTTWISAARWCSSELLASRVAPRRRASRDTPRRPGGT